MITVQLQRREINVCVIAFIAELCFTTCSS